MTPEQIAALDAKLASQIGDDVQHIYDHEALFKESRAALQAQAAELSTLRAERDTLREVLAEGRRAIGDHFAPNDCYATGPMTGDPIRDLVQCPACSFIAMHDEAQKGGA